jgi:hypothetical protein
MRILTVSVSFGVSSMFRVVCFPVLRVNVRPLVLSDAHPIRSASTVLETMTEKSTKEISDTVLGASFPMVKLHRSDT